MFGTVSLENLVKGLKEAWGENLVSLVLYGSAAAGDFVERKSDLNLMAVLRDDSASALGKAAPLVKRWVKAGNPPLAVFTTAKLSSSSDVFALEFTDIRDHHKLLAGEDVFGALAPSREHARHQLENELSGAVQRLRRLILAGGDPEKLRRASLPAFLILFRHVLRFLGETPPAKKADALDPLCRRLSLDRAAFDGEGADAYLAALDKVAAAVDSLS